MSTKDFYAVVIASLALAVSIISFVLNYRHNRRASILARKPVLVFEYDGSVGWIVRNVGHGPAMNIVVAQKEPGADWFNPVRIPALSKDGKFVPVWLGHVNTTGLGATYTDVEGSPYTATCGNDLSRIDEGTEFGPWSEDEIGRHWNQAAQNESGGMNPNHRTHE